MGCRTGPPGYIGWRNRFLEIGSPGLFYSHHRPPRVPGQDSNRGPTYLAAGRRANHLGMPYPLSHVKPPLPDLDTPHPFHLATPRPPGLLYALRIVFTPHLDFATSHPTSSTPPPPFTFAYTHQNGIGLVGVPGREGGVHSQADAVSHDGEQDEELEWFPLHQSDTVLPTVSPS